jgi:Protein of unknown function (DUF2924)
MMPVTKFKGRHPAVEAELDRLASMPIVQLRLRYRLVFRGEPPKAFGPDLLRRSIAHQIQEKAYGGLSRPARRLLDQMTKAFAAKPDGKLVLPPRIKPGSILFRNWKGKGYHVTVMADGFAYDGISYGNLSEIALLITGTRWNGPRFFGLRTKPAEVIAPAARKPQLGGGSDYRKRNAELKALRGRQGRRNHGL